MLAPKVQPAHHPPVSMAAESTERREVQGQAVTCDIPTCTLPADAQGLQPLFTHQPSPS